MIRTICHISDIHIRKIPTRNEEYSFVFNNLIKSLKSKQPDRIVIPGDLVHNYLDLQSEQIVLASKFLNNLAKIAPVRITRGNHDFRSSSKSRVDSVKAIVDVIANDNVVYFEKTGFFPDDNVMWAVWHHGEKNNNPWRTKEGKDILGISDRKFTTIDLFHDPVNGCKSTTGFEMKNKSYYKLSDFKGDYLFAGDIHKKQYLNKEKTQAYSGSLIAQDFSEGDEQFHGYLLWDIKNKTVDEISIHNDWSFKNIKLTPFTDFDELDIDIENPTKHMKGRIIWSTLPSTRNNDNERKVVEYLKDKYPNIIISHNNEFVEEDAIDLDEDTTIENITTQDVQHEIFKNYLQKIGVEEEVIEDIINLDIEITNNLTLEEITNIEWSVIKFGGTNFMSYENLHIDWRDMDGIFQITGKNANGKTTILKAISYILFGKTLETETRVKFGDSRFVNDKNGATFTDNYMVIEANGEYFGIKRRTDIETKKDGEIKGAPTKVSYYKLSSPDDEMNDENSIDSLTDDNKNKTQKKIDQIIGSYDNFMRVVMTTSDTLNRVLSNDMAVFIDSLLYDSGLDIFDKKLTAVKEYSKEINKKSRVSCNVEITNENIRKLKNENKTIEDEITDIETNKIPELKDKIKTGGKYILDLTKKLYKIDPEIQNLDVESTKEKIKEHQDDIDDLNKRKKILKDSIKPLKESYNAEELEKLQTKKEEHKQKEYDLKLKIKECNTEITDEEHKIEIINGKIHQLKKSGKEKKEEITELKQSKICPTCGQAMTEDHKKHIDLKIDEIKKTIHKYVDEIEKHEKTINTHNDVIAEIKEKIVTHENNKEKMSLEMEDILNKIGELTNDKNDVEKRKEFQNELDNIPMKIENKELQITSLNEKITNFDNSQKQIEQNKKINGTITRAEERLNTLKDEEGDINEDILVKKTKLNENALKISQNEQLIKEFKEQEYRDIVIEHYKKCVHREGIPKQLLSNNIIPKINRELEKILNTIPFKIWFDIDDLRPKLAYSNTPNAIIDAISASGKERTFASIVIKFALNQINVKSKPTIFLLDEIMGKLVDESVEEFIEILQTIKNRVKKMLVIEHTHEIFPDHIIDVTRSDKGISTAEIR
ncbi:MAG: AAA family ATPase [bacterium]